MSDTDKIVRAALEAWRESDLIGDLVQLEYRAFVVREIVPAILRAAAEIVGASPDEPTDAMLLELAASTQRP